MGGGERRKWRPACIPRAVCGYGSVATFHSCCQPLATAGFQTWPDSLKGWALWRAKSVQGTKAFEPGSQPQKRLARLPGQLGFQNIYPIVGTLIPMVGNYCCHPLGHPCRDPGCLGWALLYFSRVFKAIYRHIHPSRGDYVIYVRAQARLVHLNGWRAK